MQVFHIATVADWTAAQASGFYTTSTIGRTLQEEGFLHTSRGDQWEGVRSRFYAGVTEPLVLLVIDTDVLTSPWKEDPVGDDTFPHIYGPLNPEAVIATVPLQPLPSPTDSEAGSAIASVSAAGGIPTDKSFSRLLVEEIGFRVLLLVGVMVVSIAGFALWHTFSGTTDYIGALIGLVIGGFAAFRVAKLRG